MSNQTNQSMSRGGNSMGGHVTPTFGHNAGASIFTPSYLGPAPLSPNRVSSNTYY